MTAPTYMKPADVAKCVGCDIKSVYNAIHAGQLAAIRIGPRFKISPDALKAWETKGETK